jgi:hypothetical protein
MKTLIEHVSGWFAIIAWLAGIVIAKGFWIILSSVFFPPFAWYLLIERYMP